MRNRLACPPDEKQIGAPLGNAACVEFMLKLHATAAALILRRSLLAATAAAEETAVLADKEENKKNDYPSAAVTAE